VESILEKDIKAGETLIKAYFSPIAKSF